MKWKDSMFYFTTTKNYNTDFQINTKLRNWLILCYLFQQHPLTFDLYSKTRSSGWSLSACPACNGPSPPDSGNTELKTAAKTAETRLWQQRGHRPLLLEPTRVLAGFSNMAIQNAYSVNWQLSRKKTLNLSDWVGNNQALAQGEGTTNITAFQLASSLLRGTFLTNIINLSNKTITGP